MASSVMESALTGPDCNDPRGIDQLIADQEQIFLQRQPRSTVNASSFSCSARGSLEASV